MGACCFHYCAFGYFQDMDKQIVKDDWNPPINVCSKDVLILVIDGDHTSLAVIGGILRSWKYNVETVRNGGEALTILRTKTDKKFDLVVTDIHMPDMNGFELLRCISADFQVPIVMMSSDDSEGTMAKGLECGAAYFMRKPVCPDDLQNLWLYAIPKRDEDSSNQIVIQDTNTLKNLGNKIIDINQDAGSSAHFTKITSQVPLPIIQYINPATAPTEKYYDEIRRRRKLSNWNQKPMANTSVVPQSYSSSVFTNKKQKVAWTTGLHNKFLDALKIIGLDRAVPKKILEVMNVPGLTRENVASHLQKYRIFLKRVADIAERVDGMTKTSRSKFALNYLPLQSGFNLENLDTADENLLRKKLKQELRAMRDPLSTTPSWRHRGTMLVSNNVGTSKISFSNSKYPTFPLEPDNQISGEGSVEFSATSSTNNSMLGSSRVKEIMYQGHTALDNASGNITTANSQIVTNQRPSAFVQYGMNINGSEVHTGGLVNNLVTQGTNNPGQVTFGNYGIMQNEPSHPLELTNVNHEAGNGYMYAMSSNLENPGFQADFSEYLIQQLGGSGDQTVNSLEQGGSVGNPFLALGNHSVQTQLQNKNQETEPISNRKFGEESNLSNNRSREGSYFGEDFNPWFDQEPLQTQAGIPNANIHIADELYAVYQGCQGNAVDSSDISSSKKSSGPKE